MRKLIRLLNCAIVTVVCCVYSLNSHALMEPTHASVNRHIANNTVMGFSLNQYLLQELKWNSGIETDLGEKKVWEWLEEGGKLEDSPILRSFNHFHDPTRTWDVAGLWGGRPREIVRCVGTDPGPAMGLLFLARCEELLLFRSHFYGSEQLKATLCESISGTRAAHAPGSGCLGTLAYEK
jgi:hypothetical protein